MTVRELKTLCEAIERNAGPNTPIKIKKAGRTKEKELYSANFWVSESRVVLILDTRDGVTK